MFRIFVHVHRTEIFDSVTGYITYFTSVCVLQCVCVCVLCSLGNLPYMSLCVCVLCSIGMIYEFYQIYIWLYLWLECCICQLYDKLHFSIL